MVGVHILLRTNWPRGNARNRRQLGPYDKHHLGIALGPGIACVSPWYRIGIGMGIPNPWYRVGITLVSP